MTDSHDLSAPADEPVAAAASAPAHSPGAVLLNERRNQGLSLGDIARQLKLSVRQVEALERDDYANFSGPVFIRGFLRNYARLLHLDPEPLLQAASVATAPVSVDPGVAPYVPVSSANSDRWRRVLVWSALAGLVVLGVILLASNASREQQSKPAARGMAPLASRTSAPVDTLRKEAPPPRPAPVPAESPGASPPGGADETVSSNATPSAPPAQPFASAGAAAAAAPGPVQPAPADALAAGGSVLLAQPSPPLETGSGSSQVHPLVTGGSSSQIHMVFEDESWVEVKDGSGATIFSRLNSPGTERVVKGNPPLTVVVGNAHAVRLTYKQKAVDLSPHTRVDVARIVLE